MRELKVSLPQPCGEDWEAMAPTGCNRHCASCDKIIYDLEQHAFDDVETLVANGEDVCVRVRIGSNGSIALKPATGRLGGRLMMAAASAGLIAAASPALAKAPGKITGQIETSFWAAKVYATDASGKRFRASLKRNGRYWIKNLPPGDYVVTASSCDGDWTVGKVTVSGGEARLAKASEPGQECIIIGVMKVESHEG